MQKLHQHKSRGCVKTPTEEYMTFSKKLIFSASLAAMMAGGTALAQDADTTDAAAEEDRRLGIITVTSQKREQSLQDVPVVVTALGTEVLEDAGVRDIKDLTVLTPGLIGHFVFIVCRHNGSYSRRWYGREQSRA